MSSCIDILKEMKATPEEIKWIENQVKLGAGTEEITDRLIDEIKNQRHRKANNEISETNTNEFLRKLSDVATKVKKPYNALFKFLVGDTSGITSRSLARAQARAGFFAAKLRMPNRDIKAKLNDKGFVSDLITEMDNFTGVKKTKNDLAFELAGAITAYQKRQVAELNSFGGGVLWRDDYITKQWHDAYRMLKVDRDVWVNDVMKALDYNLTKDRIRNIILDRKMKWNEKQFDMKKYLRSAYTAMTAKSTNKGLLLDSLHLKRTLKFKDSKSFIDYNKSYGHENVAHAIFENMTMVDNHISFGEAFGFGYRKRVKPDEATLRQHQDALHEAKMSGEQDLILEAENALENLKWKEVNPTDELQREMYNLHRDKRITGSQYRRLRGALSQVTGDSYQAGSPTLSKFVTGFQFWEYITKLGKATLSSVNDLWTGAVILHYQGVKPGRAYLGLINHVLKKATQQISTKERDVLLRQLNVGVDGIFETYSRNYINNPSMGTLNKLTDTMFDLNLLNWWTNSSREGVAKMMSMHFADNLSKSFDNVPTRFKALLEAYDLNSKDWDILRKVGAFDETKFKTGGDKKNKFFTSDHFIDTVTEPLEGGGWKVKDEWADLVAADDVRRIEQSINRYYIMESRVAVPEAGAADRAWMFGEHARGSLPESTLRLFFQFRTHQVKMIRALAPRMYEMGTPSLAHILPAIGLGYVSASLKNMVAGKEPMAYDDPQTLIRSLEQSGFLGFLADFLGGQFGNYKHDMDEAIAGSAYKTLNSWAELGTELVRGNKDAVDFYNHLRHQIPFANLFWTEAAVNYFIHYNIMEAFRPGYKKRLEARARGTNSDYLIKPSSIWGG